MTKFGIEKMEPSKEVKEVVNWQEVAKGFEEKYLNLRNSGVVTSTSTATAGSVTASVIMGKLTVAHLRALRFHVYNHAWLVRCQVHS